MANVNLTILYEFIENINFPVCIVNDGNTIIYSNKNMIMTFGNLLGESANMVTKNESKTNPDTEGLDTNINIKRITSKRRYMGEALYKITSYPVDVDEGNYTVKTFHDVTDEVKMEAQLKNNYNNLIKETKFARNIQHSALPIGDEYWNMLDLRAEYYPADELSGDMFDIIKLNDNEVLFYMADVSGHGIKAALLTIFLQEVVRGISHIALSEDLDKLLAALLKRYGDLELDSEIYFSILMCKYSKNTQELSMANAGHNCFPMILRKGGRIEEVPIKGMPITGIGFSMGYDVETIGIYEGDRVLLYTDGIIEEYSESKGTEFGVIGMRNVVGESFDLPGEELAKKIIKESEKHSKAKAKDDRTILVATIL